MSDRPAAAGDAEALDDLIEQCFDRGWTDGLPVVPPTESKVLRFLMAGGYDPEEVVGTLAQRSMVVTAGKAAVNGVLAGCRPEYAPVVFAAAEALLAPEHNANGANASTGGSAPLVIVNGPIAREIGLNNGGNLLGPGNRANATIGRALRLILLNCLGNHPGVFDRSTFGHAGKYSYCIAEQEDEMAWAPLHVERGLSGESSAVTVFAALASHQVSNHFSADPEGICKSIADVMASGAHRPGYYVVIVGRDHRAVLERAGWDKRRVRECLAAEAYRTVGEMIRKGALPPEAGSPDSEERVHRVSGPDQILLVAAGGPGQWSAVIPPWGTPGASLPVTRPVRRG